MTETQLFQKLVKLYATYTPSTITPVLNHHVQGEDGIKTVPVNYGDYGRLRNLESLVTDWLRIGRVASKGMRNSKKRKVRKIVEGKYRKAIKLLRKRSGN